MIRRLLATGTALAIALALAVPSMIAASSASAMPLSVQNWRSIKPTKVRFIPRIETTDKVFFITIDDGSTKDPSVARWVRHTRTPITAFLTASANSDETADFFRTVTRYGSVQNHTRTHPALTYSSTDVHDEVCGIQSTYAKRFGTRPWMLRPPYGNGGWPSDSNADHARIASVVGPCGIKYVVNWYALVDNSGRFVSQSGTDQIFPGDIVLLHFVPGLRDQLAALVERGRQSGLKPADLADYLPRPSPPLAAARR